MGLKNIIQGLFHQTDEQAMSRVRIQDDAQAFGQLMDRWRSPIHRLCTRMLGNEARGEDAVQEVFTKVYVKRHQFPEGVRFSTWVWRIALNVCYDELRRQQRQARWILEGTETGPAIESFLSSEPGPDLQAQQTERATEVRQALEKIPEIYRSVLILRHYENLKFSEIAEVLEIPEGTVKSRMVEGLAQMEKLLTRHPQPQILCHTKKKLAAV